MTGMTPLSHTVRSESKAGRADVAEIACTLSKAQRATIIRIGEVVVSASEVNAHTARALFERGLISEIMAAGFRFTNLTELGEQVRTHILTEEQQP